VTIKHTEIFVLFKIETAAAFNFVQRILWLRNRIKATSGRCLKSHDYCAKQDDNRLKISFAAFQGFEHFSNAVCMSCGYFHAVFIIQISINQNGLYLSVHQSKLPNWNF